MSYGLGDVINDTISGVSGYFTGEQELEKAKK